MRAIVVTALFTLSSVVTAETLKLEAPDCGPAIKKSDVKVIDAREINDSEVLADQLWQKLGP